MGGGRKGLERRRVFLISKASSLSRPFSSSPSSILPSLSTIRVQVKEVSGNVATVTASDGAEVRVTLSPELGSALDAPVVEFVAVVRGAGEVEEVARAPLAGTFGEEFICLRGWSMVSRCSQ